ncbi:hypothetical protein GF382_00420 [Candidatus Falkowbacteria bacterium]|nr:hypothetical protein [Candidatus Falkowbacteria bacterium]
MRTKFTFVFCVFLVVFMVMLAARCSQGPLEADKAVNLDALDYIDSAWMKGDDSVVIIIRYSVSYAPHDREGRPDQNLIKDPSIIGGGRGWERGDERRLIQPTPVNGYMKDVMTFALNHLTVFSLVLDANAWIWVYPDMAEKSDMRYSTDNSLFGLRPKMIDNSIVILNDDYDTLYRSGELDGFLGMDISGKTGDSISMVSVGDSIHIYYSTIEDYLRIRILKNSVVVATKRARAVKGWAEFVFARERGNDPIFILLDDKERMKRCRFWSDEYQCLMYQFISAGFQ